MVNVVLVGSGRDLLIGLLRSRWVETSSDEAAKKEEVFLFGRKQDAIFSYESAAGDSVYELRLWLAPMLQPRWSIQPALPGITESMADASMNFNPFIAFNLTFITGKNKKRANLRLARLYEIIDLVR